MNDRPAIIECVQSAIVVAYNEDVSDLVRALQIEGFEVRVNRHQYSALESTYSPVMRGLINHASVWKSIAEGDKAALVVEADFVPCRGLGREPIPSPASMIDRSWGWLYMTGPIVYEWIEQSARGHSASPVATIVPPGLALALIEYARQRLAIEPEKYYPWDAGARYFVQQKGFPSFLSFRNLGEHGGIPNPEHKMAGLRSTHRADALASRLHFLPRYADGSRLKFIVVRAMAKFWGALRLLTGRYLPFKSIRETRPWESRMSLLGFSIKRLLTFR